jgi:hypothetical protein
MWNLKKKEKEKRTHKNRRETLREYEVDQWEKKGWIIVG